MTISRQNNRTYIFLDHRIVKERKQIYWFAEQEYFGDAITYQQFKDNSFEKIVHVLFGQPPSVLNMRKAAIENNRTPKEYIDYVLDAGYYCCIYVFDITAFAKSELENLLGVK